MRVLFYTDLHVADQNPRSRTGSYKDDILTKLNEIVDLALKLNVDYLINGADTFDRKSAWRVSHKLVLDMIDILRRFPAERHLTCVGTHDVPTGRLDKLAQQPLGVLEAAGVITVLGDPKDHDTLNAYDGEKVIFHFVPARYDLDKDPKNYAWSGEHPGWTVITTAHGMIVPPGRGFFDDHTPADLLAKHTTADAVLYGHPHTPDGVYLAGSSTVFCGPGSISRRDSSSYNRARTPQVALLAFKPGQPLTPENFKLVPLKSARSSSEVFAEVIRDELDENHQQAELNRFVQNLAGARIADDAWGMETLVAEINAAEVEEPVKREARSILEAVSE